MNFDAASDIDQNAHPRELSAGSPGPVAAGPIIALPGREASRRSVRTPTIAPVEAPTPIPAPAASNLATMYHSFLTPTRTLPELEPRRENFGTPPTRWRQRNRIEPGLPQGENPLLTWLLYVMLLYVN